MPSLSPCIAALLAAQEASKGLLRRFLIGSPGCFVYGRATECYVRFVWRVDPQREGVLVAVGCFFSWPQRRWFFWHAECLRVRDRTKTRATSCQHQMPPYRVFTANERFFFHGYGQGLSQKTSCASTPGYGPNSPPRVIGFQFAELRADQLL